MYPGVPISTCNQVSPCGNNNRKEDAISDRDRLLTRAEVESRVGLTKTSIYRMMRAGQFPEPLRISTRAVRWSASEIEAWLADRPRASGEAQAA